MSDKLYDTPWGRRTLQDAEVNELRLQGLQIEEVRVPASKTNDEKGSK